MVDGYGYVWTNEVDNSTGSNTPLRPTDATSYTVTEHKTRKIVVDEDEYQDVSDNPKVHKNADDDSIIDIPAHEVKQVQSTHLQNVHKEKLYISKEIL